MVVRNSYSTASLTNGQWCGWDTITDKDGVNVTKISGLIRAAPAGCAVQTITSGSYGLIQVCGATNAIVVYQGGRAARQPPAR